MKTTVKQLKELIREVMQEGQWGTPTGSIRGSKNPRTPGGRQVKAGKIEDTNKKLSTTEVESMFPGAVAAWTEVVPELFPEYPVVQTFKTDPNPRALPDAIKNSTLWTKIGDTLRVGFKDMPQLDVAKWDPSMEDWVEEAVPSLDSTRGW
jgi:hypothetical protein